MNRYGVVLLALLLPACTSSATGDARPSQPPAVTSPASPSPAQKPSTDVPTSPPARRGVPSGFSPRSASFVSDRHGWVLGATGRTAAVVETRDGGRTWSLAGTLPVEAADGTDRRHVRQIRFLDERVGWAYGRATYVTRDGGVTWREAALPEGRTMVSIDAAGGRTYALLGRATRADVEDAAVWTGTVGGETFTRADAAGAETEYEDLVVRGRTVLFASQLTYRVSTDAGRTWATRTPCPRDQQIRHVAAASERDLVVSCVSLDEHGFQRSLRVSRDAGRTTTTRVAESAWSGGLVAAVSPEVVTWALDPQGTDDGKTLRWSGDGGRTFRSVGPAARAESVMWAEPRFHDGAFGTVVRRLWHDGDRFHAVYATRDAGRSWERLPIR